ncbi:hypothetical protein FHR72_004283 [Mycolicibacterium iranicum]|uniref:Uncharacterized protein n=1 Tax=Mycolicibacterium iranicum TaxID=912594 RepID=A0A839Q9P7_MYCIR|nr:hypothetical protein [Mycolicibacterium iranicum]MBB2992779.1 hypothetical protein [Mycolicibacterium iranicum]
MTMPSDGAEAIESQGSNEGPREDGGTDTDRAYVDENNVPHPGDGNGAG